MWLFVLAIALILISGQTVFKTDEELIPRHEVYKYCKDHHLLPIDRIKCEFNMNRMSFDLVPCEELFPADNERLLRAFCNYQRPPKTPDLTEEEKEIDNFCKGKFPLDLAHRVDRAFCQREIQDLLREDKSKRR
jgi:hypothetical protein